MDKDKSNIVERRNAARKDEAIKLYGSQVGPAFNEFVDGVRSGTDPDFLRPAFLLTVSRELISGNETKDHERVAKALEAVMKASDVTAKRIVEKTVGPSVPRIRRLRGR